MTDQLYQANDPNIADYNADVQADANAAGLGMYNGNPVTWQAVASTVNNPATPPLLPNSSATPPLYNVIGGIIARNDQQLWAGTILSAPNIDQNGEFRGTYVWTGILATPSTAPNCTVASTLCVGGGTPILGYSNNPASTFWYNATDESGSDFASLYAVSQVLTVPAATPEPATGAIIGVAIAGLLAARRRRRNIGQTMIS